MEITAPILNWFVKGQYLGRDARDAVIRQDKAFRFVGK